MTRMVAQTMKYVDVEDDNYGDLSTGYWNPKGMVSVVRAMRVEVDAFPPQAEAGSQTSEIDALVDEGALASTATPEQRRRAKAVVHNVAERVMKANGLDRDELVAQYRASRTVPMVAGAAVAPAEPSASSRSSSDR